PKNQAITILTPRPAESGLHTLEIERREDQDIVRNELISPRHIRRVAGMVVGDTMMSDGGSRVIDAVGPEIGVVIVRRDDLGRHPAIGPIHYEAVRLRAVSRLLHPPRVFD